MTGTIKLKFLVISQSKRLWCFKVVKCLKIGRAFNKKSMDDFKIPLHRFAFENIKLFKVVCFTLNMALKFELIY